MLQTLVDALQAKISSEAALQHVIGCMRIVANVWAMLQSLDTLDTWTLAQVRAWLKLPSEDPVIKR